MSHTVAQVSAAYLKHCERQNRHGAFSADHLSNTRRSLDRFLAHVGADKPALLLKQHDLSGWLDANEDRWKSYNTRRNAASAVIGAFKFAEDEELIDRCPFRTPRSLRGETGKPRRPATTGEYLSLFRAGSRPLRNALFFLRETGARTCEMRECLWTDITFGDQPCVTLFQHKTARKTGKSRVIALNAVVARFLLWVRRSARSSPHVFVNCDSGPWDRHTFARHLRRTAERIGLDDGVVERVTAYCLRHTYACAALTAGFTSKEVADQLGHVDTKMVERVYGSHTGRDVGYLTRIADSIRKRRA